MVKLFNLNYKHCQTHFLLLLCSHPKLFILWQCDSMSLSIFGCNPFFVDQRLAASSFPQVQSWAVSRCAESLSAWKNISFHPSNIFRDMFDSSKIFSKSSCVSESSIFPKRAISCPLPFNEVWVVSILKCEVELNPYPTSWNPLPASVRHSARHHCLHLWMLCPSFLSYILFLSIPSSSSPSPPPQASLLVGGREGSRR